MTFLALALVVVVLLIFLLNTQRWTAIGRGLRRSRRDFREELDGRKDE